MNAIRSYPTKGSQWYLTVGPPPIEACKFVVMGSGHGSVVVKQCDADYWLQIDILGWDRYLPCAVDEEDSLDD